MITTTAPDETNVPEPTTAPAITATPTAAPAKGTKLKDTKTKAVYKVTKTKETVEFVKTTNSKATSIQIANTVKIDGITYKVTSIAAKALKGNKKIKKLTIGKNVDTIGASAFQDCSNLKQITIQTSALKAKKIGSKAFKGIHKKAVIRVPAKKVENYKKILKKAEIGSKVVVKK